MKRPSLSIIIPCYNEESVITDTIVSIAGFLSDKGFEFEIIPVNDGSTDGTAAKIREAKEKLPNIRIEHREIARNRGKGHAIKEGVKESQNDIIVFVDADLTVSIAELDTFLPNLERYDIAIASRALPQTVFEENNPWYRAFLAKGFRFFHALILGRSGIKDTQCGFKVFRKEAAKKIFEKLTIERFTFDAEALFLAQRFGYSVCQLPVTIHRDTRESHINALTDPINMLFALMKIRINAILGRYDAS